METVTLTVGLAEYSAIIVALSQMIEQTQDDIAEYSTFDSGMRDVVPTLKEALADYVKAYETVTNPKP